MTPLVSAVIPCYNGQDYILEAIKSIDNQTYSNIEIVVVDDNSTDESVATVQASSPSRELILRTHSENRGISETRNTGIEAANGKYISFLDQDDIWDKTKIEKQVKYMERYPDAGVVLTDLNHVGEDGCLLHQREFSDDINEMSTETLATYFFKFWEHKPMPITTSLYRSNVFEEIGSYNPDLYGANDRDLLIRSLSEFDMGLVEEPLLSKRYHSENASNAILQMIDDRRKLTERMIQLYPFLEKYRTQRESYLDLLTAREYARMGIFHKSLRPLLASIYRTPTFSFEMVREECRDYLVK